MKGHAAAAARFRAITGCDEFPPSTEGWSWELWERRLAQLAPDERRRLGVWTTPEPLVKAVLDDVELRLRQDFGLEDGLADETTWASLVARGVVSRPGHFPWEAIREQPFVRILDPACGTGVFPAAVIGRAGPGVSQRLHAVEIDPVAWGLCHLAVAPARPDLRLGNGLDPWTPDAPVTVVVGNPPWSGLSENRGWIVDLLRGRVDGDSYYELDGEPLGERKVWLQDDYVKFVRLAQYHVRRAGAGVLGLVTNHGWIDNPTFRGMRQSLLGTFGSARVLDLGGNMNRREGADENVFGIRQGVSLMSMSTHGTPEVRVGTLRGPVREKLQALGDGLPMLCPTAVAPRSPSWRLRETRPRAAEYARFTPVTALFSRHTTGLVTARDHFVVGFTPQEVLARIEALRDPSFTDAQIRQRFFAGKGSRKYPAGDTRGWKLSEARQRIRDDPAWRERVRPYYYRALDVRWVYAAPWMIDWGRPDVAGALDPAFARDPRTDLAPATSTNLALLWMRQVSTGGRFSHALVTRQPPDNRCMRSSRGICSFAPLWIGQSSNVTAPGLEGEDPLDVLGFVYAQLWSPGFVEQFHEELCADVPRVPLDRYDPAVAARGRWLMALHLGEVAVERDGPGCELGGVDAPRRYRKARTKRGRALVASLDAEVARVAAIAAATAAWQLGPAGTASQERPSE